MPDVLIDPTVVENLVGGLLVSGPDKVSPAVRVLYPHDPVPSAHADSPSDTVYERWCRINSVRMPDAGNRRNTPGDNDQQAFVIVVTCGVSTAQMRLQPARLNQVAHQVRAALRGAYAEHDATTTSIQIENASLDIDAAGEHPIHLTAVVACSGMAQRISGYNAVLTT